MGIPHGGQFPNKKRRRQPHVDIAAMDARAREENEARAAEAERIRQAEEAAEAERLAKAQADAEAYLNTPGRPPEGPPDEGTKPEPEGNGQDIAAALAAAGAAEGHTGDVLAPEGRNLNVVPENLKPGAKAAKQPKTAKP